MSIQVVIQSPDADTEIELFELDLSIFGDMQPRRFTNCNSETPIVWNGEPYTPVPFETGGFEWSVTGSLPRPTFRVSNVGGFFGALASIYPDLVGATVTRYLTFRRFLDDGVEPDPEAYLTKDVFTIRRKVEQNPVYIEFELFSNMDQESRMLPGRQILKSACTHTYRLWDADTSTFVYTKASCPYAGNTYFDANGNSVSAANDRCGKSLEDCRDRFGQAGVLPFRGFPGAGSID